MSQTVLDKEVQCCKIAPTVESLGLDSAKYKRRRITTSEVKRRCAPRWKVVFINHKYTGRNQYT